MRSFAETELAAVAPLLRRYEPPPAPSGLPLSALCERALAEPVESAPLEELARGARRIAIVISDGSRDEPRGPFLDALLARVDAAKVTLVVASGTHKADASVVPARYAALPVHVHDGADEAACVDLGVTAEGTRVRLSRVLAEADLVIVTGRMRPHYFAGYSGGAKGIFPGCALAADALQNHLMKADPTARLGRVADNRCRLDMEAAARLLPGRSFLLNVLADVNGEPVAAAAGDIVAAHRSLVARAESLFLVEAARSSVVVVADCAPVSSSLYQASKLLPPAGALLEPGGTLFVVADCAQGIGGSLSRVNDGIYRLGVAAQLPAEHRVLLHSQMTAEVVATTYATRVAHFADELRTALSSAGLQRAPLLWRAGEMVVRAVESRSSGVQP